jgi:hypothetical protein
MEGHCVGVILRFVPKPMEISRRMATVSSFLRKLGPLYPFRGISLVKKEALLSSALVFVRNTTRSTM